MDYDFQPENQRYDVAIIAFHGLCVHGVAACHVKMKEAQEQKYQLRENLSRQFFMVIVPSGTLQKGQQFEKTPHVRKSKVNHGMTTYRRREADHVCVLCESPQLETRTYCLSCLQKSNARLNRRR